MSGKYELNAAARGDAGKGASRRLRRQGERVPGIIYGGDKDPATISLSHKDLAKALEDEGYYSHIISLSVDGAAESVILKALQRHPSRPVILHADFLRVRMDRKISVHVPLHFVNQEKCAGVKLQGGFIQHNANELHITCLPQDLPEYIEVDMIACELGSAVHISDLKLPPGVESVLLSHGPEHDTAVATVLAPKGSAEEAPAAAAADASKAAPAKGAAPAKAAAPAKGAAPAKAPAKPAPKGGK